MCKIISIINNKGGVGKTTTTLNLGIGLAMRGKKVLLIDNDPQGSLTSCLGYQDLESLKSTAASVLWKYVNGIELKHQEGVIHHEEGIDLLPCNLEMSSIELALMDREDKNLLLKGYLSLIKKEYDYILIDCLPSLSLMTINALVASNRIIIPIQPEYLSVKGLNNLIVTSNMIKSKLNKDLRFGGILFTMANLRTNYAKDIRNLVIDTYGKKIKVFDSVIPRSVKFGEASAMGKSIYAHSPKSKGAQAYSSLVDEFVGGRK